MNGVASRQHSPIENLPSEAWADLIRPPTPEQVDAACRCISRWAAKRSDRNQALVEIVGALGLAVKL